MASAAVGASGGKVNYKPIDTLVRHWGNTADAGVEDKQKKICEESGLDSLLNLARMPHVKVQSLAISVINSLRERDNGEIYVDSEEGFRPLVDLTKFPEEEVQREAVWSLAILASNNSCQVRIEQEVGWHNFRKYAASPVPEIQAGTAILLGNLALEKKNQENLMAKGVPILMTMLQETKDAKVRRAVVTSLSNVSIIEGYGAKDIWINQGLDLMMPFIEQNDDPQLQIGALNTIANVCNHDTSVELKRKVAELGGIGRLVPLLDSQEEMIVKLAAMTIANMASEEGHRKIMHELRIEEPLIRLLDSRDEEVQLGVTMAIHALADHAPTCAEFRSRQAAEPLKELIHITKDRGIAKEAKGALAKIAPAELAALNLKRQSSYTSESYTHTSETGSPRSPRSPRSPHSRTQTSDRDSENEDDSTYSSEASEEGGESDDRSANSHSGEESDKGSGDEVKRKRNGKRSVESINEEDSVRKHREEEFARREAEADEEREKLRASEEREKREEELRKKIAEEEEKEKEKEKEKEVRPPPPEEVKAEAKAEVVERDEGERKKRLEEPSSRRKEVEEEEKPPKPNEVQASPAAPKPNEAPPKPIEVQASKPEPSVRPEPQPKSPIVPKSEPEKSNVDEERQKKRQEEEAFRQREAAAAAVAVAAAGEGKEERGERDGAESKGKRKSKSMSGDFGSSSRVREEDNRDSISKMMPRRPAKALAQLLHQTYHQHKKGVGREELKELDYFARRRERDQLHHGEDVIAILVYVLYFYPEEEYPEIIVLTLYILALLARYHIRNQLAIRRTRGGEQIVRLLQSQNEDIRRNAALSLGAYCLNNEALQTESSRAIPILVRILSSNTTTALTRRTVTACLAALADNNKPNQNSILQVGGLRNAIVMLTSDPSYTRSALHLVSAVVAHNDSAQNAVILEHPRFIPDLLNLLSGEGAPLIIQAYITNTLVELMKKNPRAQRALYLNDGLAKLVPILADHERRNAQTIINIIYLLIILLKLNKFAPRVKLEMLRLRVAEFLRPLGTSKDHQMAELSQTLLRMIDSR